jgi:hypothetical protein
MADQVVRFCSTLTLKYSLTSAAEASGRVADLSR